MAWPAILHKFSGKEITKEWKTCKLSNLATEFKTIKISSKYDFLVGVLLTFQVLNVLLSA